MMSGHQCDVPEECVGKRCIWILQIFIELVQRAGALITDGITTTIMNTEIPDSKVSQGFPKVITDLFVVMIE